MNKQHSEHELHELEGLEILSSVNSEYDECEEPEYLTEISKAYMDAVEAGKIEFVEGGSYEDILAETWLYIEKSRNLIEKALKSLFKFEVLSNTRITTDYE